MQVSNRNRVLVALVVISPFVVFLGFFIFMSEDQIPLPPLPATNGYGDLVKAAGMVPASDYDYTKVDLQILNQTVSQNAAALALARAALTNECAVPLQFSTNYDETHLDDLAGLKRLGWAFVTEGRMAEMEGRTNDAVHSYLDTIRLGDACSRGGVLIDELVGIAIDQIGMNHLQDNLPQMDGPTSRETAGDLWAIDSQRQSWDQVIQQEQGWSQRTFPGIKYQMMRIMGRRTLAAAFQGTERKYDANEQKTRQLIIDLAARAYQLDKGKPPASAADLVPDYLKVIPKDPITGANLSLSSN